MGQAVSFLPETNKKPCNSRTDRGLFLSVEKTCIQEIDDIYPFALEGLTVDGSLYGIPAFLCGNFLIYDISCGILAGAEHITDLTGESVFRGEGCL